MRDICNDANCSLFPEEVSYKDIVIIGNGPSGIMLSCLLSGYLPYYNGKTHKDEMLTARLQSINKDVSLLEHDLQFLSQGLEGRSPNPVSVLLDFLSNPHEDKAVTSSSETLLSWKYHPQRQIDHIVIGKGKPGGCWQTMEEDILTISCSSRMNLPIFSYKMWESLKINEDKKYGLDDKCNMKYGAIGRARAKDIADYYNDYVGHMRLSKNFHNFTYVCTIRKLKHFHQYNMNTMDKCGIKVCKRPLWEVVCCDRLKNRRYKYLCRNIILANGTSDHHKTLSIPGELSNTDWVCRDLKHFKSAIKSLKPDYVNTNGIDPVLIVGSGLSAADCVLLARYHKLSVLHVFTTCSLLSDTLFPKNTYPEYNKVHRLMKSEVNKKNYYKAYPQHMVSDITCSTSGERQIYLVAPNGDAVSCKVSLVAIMIGYEPDLNFVPADFDGGRMLGIKKNQLIDGRRNPIHINPWTHEIVNSYPGLYAVGPIIGDNFVRVILGGAIAIVSHLYKKNREGHNR